MSYTERIKHKTGMFEIGKDSIAQLISSSEAIIKINDYIDKKMYQYLSQITESKKSNY